MGIKSKNLPRPVIGATATAIEGRFPEVNVLPRIQLILADSLQWMTERDENSVHAIVTDPPYGLKEYEPTDHLKLRSGKGGVWRIPPSFDGARRAPLPRFTVLTPAEREALTTFFKAFAHQARRILVPGGHLIIASNPLVSSTTFAALESSGLEKRGELIRLVATLRGGDRPKGAEDEFPDVSVMPRSGWEPWGLFRKPISESTVAANLRKWGTGGFMRTAGDEPFWDVFECAPARPHERELAPHPSIKPQKLMRHIVRAALPMGNGVIYDPFSGSGSTLAAAASVGYSAIGTERDPTYFAMASRAIPQLANLVVR
ncbi:site-specific DNA-methyltransferase (adenine-specific) [Variovorax sp. HW608]|uniref:DNA-methyltransferase n=1 Tax=Variovorax sp. HW608 TaxID=1034889 RepID=UPI00081FBDD1|nr:DNA methyltransferase [Variovorax sp. HW608]SCK08985.1 site-specific DNA-methyltransferase (adenine-specific) [Variovorax sp. HW608]